jgi:hypothetical protein
MRTRGWIVVTLALLIAGCSKKQEQQPIRMNGLMSVRTKVVAHHPPEGLAEEEREAVRYLLVMILALSGLFRKTPMRTGFWTRETTVHILPTIR